MRVDVITIFPEMFEPMSASMTGLAQENGALDLNVHDLRQWAHDRHRTTDDYPYGGGPGMVMKPEPLFEALDAMREVASEAPYVVFMAPVGVPFSQAIAHELSAREHLVFVCGRYEGFDERALEQADLTLSIGDYVLTGGELPAMVVIDAVTRLLPGVLGHEDSAVDESFAEGLLEYPQYTRPAQYRGMEVPEVLRSGDHARIARWRREQAIARTAQVRPDLFDAADLTEDERAVAEASRDADAG
ncbi:MAG TPA: tRNA (guanosine(37)-N1)-methyltransferase TrmD [Coriobacteriia bacterium]|nr:tRNA (guanosine(37)-N1)-methyltransferase TrmD [Coriobacteriia bacterium]